ncbi:hypothetical protein DEO72_LG2g530 [Vigna unguiculata]|uniref:Uncharacterized protein n=1 Tax=Vigna unguiculata TaxID=3917 RepID=A0A4D6KXJ0_VIGUN|nr:hypothetical protein DEO72_LG2g530 [Vigna unguiculata]
MADLSSGVEIGLLNHIVTLSDGLMRWKVKSKESLNVMNESLKGGTVRFVAVCESIASHYHAIEEKELGRKMWMLNSEGTEIESHHAIITY